MIVLMHAGANTIPRFGGFRAPIFSDGSFIFMQFPATENHVFVPELPTYKDKGWKPYVPPNILQRHIHEDPHFPDSKAPATYGHVRRPGDKIIFNLKDGAGYLFFMASLDYNPSKGGRRLPWINPKWGAYLVGWFKVKHVLTQREFLEATPEIRQEFECNPHFRRRDSEPYADIWISSSKAGLLPTAIPLSDPIKSNKPNEFIKNVFRTPTGKRISDKTPFYRIVSKCEKEIQSFWKEVFSKNPSLSMRTFGFSSDVFK